ncbi:MAG: tail fiber domain-containing protein, partial [Bacteroidales bacterium]|nr:tail fiber domain-containing protein [Bacteroidales bacterium]
VTQRNAISNPATGLIIFQSDGVPGFYFNSGNTAAPVWEMVGASAGWGLTGNTGVSASNFIGTIDNSALNFRIGNQNAGRIELDPLCTFLGYQSGSSPASGYANTGMGAFTLFSNIEGTKNVADGAYALYSNISGSYNTASGYNSLTKNRAGSKSTAIGAFALSKSNDQLAEFDAANVAIGYSAMYGPGGITATSTGIQNTAVGTESLSLLSSGSLNTVIGYRSAFNTSTGSQNTGLGGNTLLINTTGSNNTALGYIALTSSTTGNLNTAVGSNASGTTSSGFQNTSLGANSLVNNTTGSYNTAIGYNTGPNTFNLANTTTLGIDASATATDQVRIGNVFVNSIGGYVNWSNISDGRFKENLSENVPGLSFITQLRPVTYRLNRNAINAYIGVDAAYKGEVLSGITSGFVAQEVEKAAQQLGYDFSGVDAPKNDKDVYALRYSDFVVPLVKAVQELDDQNSDLKLTIDGHLQRIESQQKTIENQQAQIDELKQMVLELIQTSK